MFTIALKMIRNNKSRFICTVLGVSITVFILLVGLYYFRISKTVIEDNVNSAISERQLVVKQIGIPLVEYFDTGEEMIPSYSEISEKDRLAIYTASGVEAVCVQYNIGDEWTVIVDNQKIQLKDVLAVDTDYDTFSKALVDSCKREQSNFTDIVAGRDFSETSEKEVLLDEAFCAAIQWKPEEAVGKEIVVEIPNGENIEVRVVGVYSKNLSGWRNTSLEDIDGMLLYEGENMFENGMLFRLDFLQSIPGPAKKEWKNPCAITCSMENTDNIEEFCAKLKDDYQLNPQSDYMDYYDQLEKQKEFTDVFIVIGILLGILSLILLINTISINVHQQKRFLALLSLLGYKKGKICQYYALQSFSYGMIGAVVGAIGAYVVTTFLGLRLYSGLSSFGFTSKSLLMPVTYVLATVLLVATLSFVLGYVVAIVKARRGR